jgi:hypothetical protein
MPSPPLAPSSLLCPRPIALSLCDRAGSRRTWYCWWASVAMSMGASVSPELTTPPLVAGDVRRNTCLANSVSLSLLLLCPPLSDGSSVGRPRKHSHQATTAAGAVGTAAGADDSYMSTRHRTNSTGSFGGHDRLSLSFEDEEFLDMARLKRRYPRRPLSPLPPHLCPFLPSLISSSLALPSKEVGGV